MRQPSQYIWKQAPFLRLIIPFIAGILLQWHIQINPIFYWAFLTAGGSILFTVNRRSRFFQFRYSWLNGLVLYSVLICIGALVTYYKDLANHPNWVKRYCNDSSVLRVVLQEPLSEKPKTYKAMASVEQVVNKDTIHSVKGSIIIYFQKDSISANLSYGSQIILKRPLQIIRNSGNPATFNYQRYTAFQEIYYQVFLKKTDYLVMHEKKQAAFALFILNTRQWVLQTITRYLPDKKVAGLAEALLIGYKDDLDKTLVTAYSNTGVVHVIAISGLHVGIIYWLLLLLTAPLRRKKKMNWLSMALVIAGLWLFALLAGAGPSVLRSALMFSFLAIGECLSKKASVYNSLAASAFLLLCYHPFWIWDVGFQLSYAAVLSIVIFMKPVYHLIYFKNKLWDMLWKLNAVTLSAQLLTVPVSIYHFHQFPNYFLITNLVAVPLSSIILMGEIALCVLAAFPTLAQWMGNILQWLIGWMNSFIEYMEDLPFAVWPGLQIGLIQLVLLYGWIAAAWYWLQKKNKPALIIALGTLLVFFGLRSNSIIRTSQQKKIIVYHIPGHRAIDFINGNEYYFKADSSLLSNHVLQNLHLNPARILYRVNKTNILPDLVDNGNNCVFSNKKIMLIDSCLVFAPVFSKIKVDLLIISGNARLSIAQLQEIFDCPQIVIDGSNPPWKVDKWRTECEKRQLACHCVVDKGAFVMPIP
jgi:competence protein ComEC